MIVVPDKELRPVAEKIVRGCEYKLNSESYVEQSDELQIYFAHDQAIADVTRFIEAQAAAVSLGPGFEIRRGETPPGNEERIALYRVTLWGTLKIYATITRGATAMAQFPPQE